MKNITRRKGNKKLSSYLVSYYPDGASMEFREQASKLTGNWRANRMSFPQQAKNENNDSPAENTLPSDWC